MRQIVFKVPNSNMLECGISIAPFLIKPDPTIPPAVKAIVLPDGFLRVSCSSKGKGEEPLSRLGQAAKKNARAMLKTEIGRNFPWLEPIPKPGKERSLVVAY